MLKFRLLSALCVGTLFYVFASISCGKNSVWAENQLSEQKRILSTHTSDLEKKNEELNLEKIALQKDMDVIAAYARKLSYVRDGEKIVKLSGLRVEESKLYDPGTVLLHEDVRYFPEWFCKSVGIVAFLAVYFLLLMVDLGHGIVNFKRKKSHKARNQTVA